MEEEDKNTAVLQVDSVRLRVWHGSVPVVIHYDAKSLALDFPRLSYLPLAYAKLRETFGMNETESIYLTPEPFGEAIKCHYPVGLLYDIHATPREVWHLHLTTHSKSGGEVSIQAEAELYAFLWNSLKQNELIRQGSIRRIQNLTPLESKNLYRAMISLDFLEYWTRHKALMRVSPLRHIPIRVHLDQHHHVQDLISTRTEGTKTTLYHALAILVPKLATLGPDVVDVVVQGVVVSWTLDLVHVLEETQYVDGWIHLVLRMSDDIERQVPQEEEERDMRRGHVLKHTFQQMAT